MAFLNLYMKNTYRNNETLKLATTLEFDIKLLSLESNILNNISESLKNITFKLIHELKQANEKLSIRRDSVLDKNFYSLYMSARTNLHQKNFIVLSDTLVAIPEGMNCSYIKYVETLSVLHSSIYEKLDESLSDYKIYISDYISDKEKRSNSYGTLDIQKISDFLDVSYDQYSSLYSENVGSRIALGSVVDSVSSLEELYKKSINLNKEYVDKDVRYIIERVDEIEDNLSIVNDLLIKGKIDQTTGAVGLDISQMCYELARLVELYAIVKNDMINALNFITELLKLLSSLK